MSDLAFNMNGEPFELPPTMAAWRVRKLKPKGAPEVVYGRDGLPLFLPADADIDDLRREARIDGRYRLDPVDDHNRPVPNAQSSYVCVHPIERAPEPAAPEPAPAPTQADTTAALVAALLESQRQHTELARIYVAQFPAIANAMAGVVRSAGDVGLTTRVPLVVPTMAEPKPAAGQRDEDDEAVDGVDDTDIDEVDDIEIDDEPEYSWPRVAQTFAEFVGPHVGPLLAGLPLGAMLGAKPIKAQTDATPGPGPRAPAPASEAAPRTGSAFDASLAIRLRATLAQLTPAEQVFAKSLFDEIPADQRAEWMDRLRGMSVAEAVAYVREMHDEARAAAQAAHASTNTGPVASRAAGTPRREGVRPAVPRDARPTHAAPTMKTPRDDGAPLDPATQAHLAAIDRALTLDETAAMRKHFASLSPRNRAEWVATLLMLPADEAVAMIRRQLSGAPAPGEVPVADAPAASQHPADMPAVEPTPAESPSAKPTDAGPGDERPTNPAAARRTSRNQSAAAVGRPRSPIATIDRSPVAAGAAPTPDVISTMTTTIEPALAVAPTTMPAPTEHARAEQSSAAPPAAQRSAHTHLADIEDALAPEERLLIQTMITELSPEEREVWLDRLLSVPPAEGVALLRATLAELTQERSDERPADLPSATHPVAIAPSDTEQAQNDDQAQHDDRSARPTNASATNTTLPTLDSDALEHFKAIESALTLPEQMLARELAAQRPADELRRWYAELVELSVSEAVAKIRAELARSDRGPDAEQKRGES